jgi:hypothetical protein
MSNITNRINEIRQKYNLPVSTGMSVSRQIDNIRNKYNNMENVYLENIKRSEEIRKKREEEEYKIWKARADKAVEESVERRKRENQKKQKDKASREAAIKNEALKRMGIAGGQTQLQQATGSNFTPKKSTWDKVKDFGLTSLVSNPLLAAIDAKFNAGRGSNLAKSAIYGVGETVAKPLNYLADKAMFEWNKKANYNVDGSKSKYPQGYSKETDAIAKKKSKEEIEKARLLDEIELERVATNRPYGWTPSNAESIAKGVGSTAAEFAQMAALGNVAGGMSAATKLPKYGKFALESGIVGTGLGLLRSMDKKDNTYKDYLRNIAGETAFMGAGGLAGKGAGRIVGKGLSYLNKPAIEKIGSTVARGMAFGGGGSIAQAPFSDEKLTSENIATNALVGAGFELGLNAKGMVNNYNKTHIEYNKSLEGLNRSIQRQSEKGINKIDFNERYGLNQDISGMNQNEKKILLKKSLNKILEASGKNISGNLKTDNIYKIAQHYKEKYNLPDLKITTTIKPGGEPATTYFSQDGSAKIEINKSYTKNQQVAGLRHEIEHVIDSKAGYKGSDKIAEPEGTFNKLEELYNSVYKGHHRDYNSFDVEYLKNYNKKSELMGNQKNDIAFNEPNKVDGVKAGYERDIDKLEKININIKDRKLTNETMHMTERSSKKIKERYLDTKEAIKTIWLDRYEAIKKISRKANELFNLETQSSGTVDYIINKRLVNREGDELANKGFKDVLGIKNKNVKKQFYNYLYNKHNVDRAKYEKTLLTDLEGNQISAKRSKEIINEYEQTYPEFKKMSEQYNQLWQTFTKEWLSDFVDQKTINYLQKKYPNYVPSYRQLESFLTEIPTNRIVSGVKIKQATGSKKKIKPFDEQLVAQINKIVKSNRRNEAYKEMLKPVLKNPGKYKNVLEVVKIDKNSSEMSEKEIANQIAELKEGIVSGEDSLNLLMDLMENPLKQKSGMDGYLTIFDKGIPITVKIKDKRIYTALKKYQQDGELWKLLGIWKKFVVQPFKSLITQNPFFATRNITRDTPTAYVQGNEGNPIKFTRDNVKAMVDITLKNPLWKKYSALGGRLTNIRDNPLAPNLTGKLSKAKDNIFSIMEVAEQLNRFAEFERVYKKTGNVQDARIAAANITTNFGKGGTLSKFLENLLPFSNAAVQGLATTVRAFKNKPVQSLIRTLVSTTIPGGLFYWNIIRDDEKSKIYDEIPNNIKNSNFIIVKDKDTVIKIPKNYTTGLIFTSLGERFYDYAKRNDDKAFDELKESFINSFLPYNFKGNILAPATNLVMGGNKDYFGREIVPQSMKNLSNKNQYDERTTTVGKFLGQQFNWSPKKVDYAMDSYIGSIYDFMRKTGKEEKNIPGKVIDMGKANFTVNTSYTRTQNEYYDVLDKFRTKKADFDKSIQDKKNEVKEAGYKLTTNAGKSYLQELLTSTESEKMQEYKDINKRISEQLEELQGIEEREKTSTLRDYINELKDFKPSNNDNYGGMSSNPLYYDYRK